MINLREPLESLARQPQTYTSHLRFPDPAGIMLYDDTLRDGEQMPGVAFSPAQKVELAALLADIGIDVMDVAFPISSPSDRIALQAILEAQREGRIRKTLDVLAMCRAVPGDIDSVLEVVDGRGLVGRVTSPVLILSTASDLHLKYKLGRALLKREGRDEEAWLDTPIAFYREANIRLITDAIRHARSRGIERIEFAAEDASRSDVEYAIEWAEACIAAGGTRFCFSDTCGVLTPEGVDHYFPRIVDALGVRQRPRAAHRPLPQRLRPRRDQHGPRGDARRDPPEPHGERDRRTRRQHVDSPVRDGPQGSVRRHAAAIPVRQAPRTARRGRARVRRADSAPRADHRRRCLLARVRHSHRGDPRPSGDLPGDPRTGGRRHAALRVRQALGRGGRRGGAHRARGSPRRRTASRSIRRWSRGCSIA